MIFDQANSFSVSGNFCPDIGIVLMHQRHEIRRSQFADAAARDFCLTLAQPPSVGLDCREVAADDRDYSGERSQALDFFLQQR
jgi:hypothetical protein